MNKRTSLEKLSHTLENKAIKFRSAIEEDHESLQKALINNHSTVRTSTAELDPQRAYNEDGESMIDKLKAVQVRIDTATLYRVYAPYQDYPTSVLVNEADIEKYTTQSWDVDRTVVVPIHSHGEYIRLEELRKFFIYGE